MTTWTSCRCTREHVTAKGFLRCKIPALKWITGNGTHALIAWCGAPSITLWPSKAEAHDRASVLYATRCGTYCRQAHEVVHINHHPKASPMTTSEERTGVTTPSPSTAKEII